MKRSQEHPHEGPALRNHGEDPDHADRAAPADHTKGPGREPGPGQQQPSPRGQAHAHDAGHGHGHGQGHGQGQGHGSGRGQEQGHGHGQGHGAGDHDWDRLAPFLESEAEALRPVYEQAAARIAELRPAAGIRRILDIGSGPGVVSCLLAEAFPSAEVVAVDATPALLRRTRERAERLGLGDRVRVLEAEMPDRIRDLGPADLIWMGNSLHHIGDQRQALIALRAAAARWRTRPRRGGLPTRHLPRDFGLGRPGLEARMELANEEGFADMRAGLADTKGEVEDWAALFVAAGLIPAGTRSYLADHPAPVEPSVRDLVIERFARHRGPLESKLSPEDVATLDRLLDPADPQGLANRPDVFMLTAKSVHIGLAKP